MLQSSNFPTTNLLLQLLSAEDMEMLDPYLERLAITVGQVLASADAPVEHIYFPEGGVASVVASADETNQTEVGIIGREGMSGAMVALGVDRSPHETFVQVGDANALRISVHAFQEAIIGSTTLKSLVLRYVQSFMVQSAYSTMSNAHHRIEARLARWLLMCHDRVDGNEIRITHEFMSMMIAAQRTGVTACLHILEGAGMIRSKRARVLVLNREKLIDLAGDAYGQPEREYQRLFGSLTAGRPAVEPVG